MPMTYIAVFNLCLMPALRVTFNFVNNFFCADSEQGSNQIDLSGHHRVRKTLRQEEEKAVPPHVLIWYRVSW